MTCPALSPPLHRESLEAALLEMSETAVPQLAADSQMSLSWGQSRTSDLLTKESYTSAREMVKNNLNNGDQSLRPTQYFKLLNQVYQSVSHLTRGRCLQMAKGCDLLGFTHGQSQKQPHFLQLASPRLPATQHSSVFHSPNHRCTLVCLFVLNHLGNFLKALMPPLELLNLLSWDVNWLSGLSKLPQ